MLKDALSIVVDGREQIRALRSREWAIWTRDLKGQSIGLRQWFSELLARLDPYSFLGNGPLFMRASIPTVYALHLALLPLTP
jgi:hypothetical protein